MQKIRLSNKAYRRLQERARIALKTGDWGEWQALPPDRAPLVQQMRDTVPWVTDSSVLWGNKVGLLVLRKVRSPVGEVIHIAVRTYEERPLSREAKARIVLEVAGPDRTAIEAHQGLTGYPGEDLFQCHLWVVPRGLELPVSFDDGLWIVG